jgi:hypothetical protein
MLQNTFGEYDAEPQIRPQHDDKDEEVTHEAEAIAAVAPIIGQEDSIARRSTRSAAAKKSTQTKPVVAPLPTKKLPKKRLTDEEWAAANPPKSRRFLFKHNTSVFVFIAPCVANSASNRYIGTCR